MISFNLIIYTFIIRYCTRTSDFVLSEQVASVKDENWSFVYLYVCNYKTYNVDIWYAKKEEIWLSPMTKARAPTEKFQKQRANTNHTTKNFDYTTIADRLRTVSWSNNIHPACLVKLV